MKALHKISAILIALLLLFQLTSVISFAAENNSSWVGAWSTSPVEAVVEAKGVKASDFLVSQSVRVVVIPTLDGNKVRFKFSNKYGNSDIKINAANVAKAVKEDDYAIFTDTIQQLTVNKEASFVVKKGTHVYTDAVTMKIKALEPVAVSYYVSSFQQMATAGLCGGKAYICTRNKINDETFPNGVLLESNISGLKYNTIPYLVNMDVWAKNSSSIVIIGDSTVANNIPELLAEKLVGSGIRNTGVLQQAICGNRLLYDGVGLIGNIYGDAMINRFSSDAIKQFGVSKIFVKIGVNDILHPRTASMSGKAPEASVDEIISGYEQLVSAAHEKGIKIYFFEITPWKGYTRELLNSDIDLNWSEETQSLCNELNVWIMNNKVADGYVNLSILSDENDSDKLKDGYTQDGIHFTNMAQVAVVDAIPASFLGFSESHLTPLKKILADKLGGDWAGSGGNDSDVPSTTPVTVTDAVTQGSGTVQNTESANTDAAQATEESTKSNETNILMNSAELGNRNDSGIIVDNEAASSFPAAKIILIVGCVLVGLILIAAAIIIPMFIKAAKKRNEDNITPLR